MRPSSKTFVGNTASLSSGTYTIAGSITDGDNNSSDWSFDLIVQPATIDQTAPTLTIASQSIAKGATFAYSLNESNDISNRELGENYTITITHPNGTGITYDSTTKTFNGATSSLESGIYTIVGTISDDNNNESTWAFNLTIEGGGTTAPPLLNIVAQSVAQGSPFSYTIAESTDISYLESSDTYTIQILDTGGSGITYDANSYTFSADTTMLDIGRYVILGTIANSSAIQSSWFFYLTLLDQTAPRLNVPIVRVAVGQDFSFPLQRGDHILDLREGESYTLSITNDGGTGITYDPTEGALTATTNTLSVGTYTVTGTISDGDSNESTWSLDLLVESPRFLLSKNSRFGLLVTPVPITPMEVLSAGEKGGSMEGLERVQLVDSVFSC